MDQCGGLQGLIGRFVGHARRSELAQFAIDQRQQFIGGLGIAVFDGFQNAGDVAQPLTINRFSCIAPEKRDSCAIPDLHRAFHRLSRKNCAPADIALVTTKKAPRPLGSRSPSNWSSRGRLNFATCSLNNSCSRRALADGLCQTTKLIGEGRGLPQSARAGPATKAILCR